MTHRAVRFLNGSLIFGMPISHHFLSFVGLDHSAHASYPAGHLDDSLIYLRMSLRHCTITHTLSSVKGDLVNMLLHIFLHLELMHGARLSDVFRALDDR